MKKTDRVLRGHLFTVQTGIVLRESLLIEGKRDERLDPKRWPDISPEDRFFLTMLTLGLEIGAMLKFTREAGAKPDTLRRMTDHMIAAILCQEEGFHE